MDNEDNGNNNNSGYVPASDETGLRKTFPTPEFVGVKKEIIKTKYPFETISVGESFPILYTEMKKKSVAPYASKMGKKYAKKFQVTDCPQYDCYLISCMEVNVIEEAEGKQIIPAETFDPNYPITPELARYARENGLTNAQAQAKLIADGVTPWALKGMMNKKELEND